MGDSGEKGAIPLTIPFWGAAGEASWVPPAYADPMFGPMAGYDDCNGVPKPASENPKQAYGDKKVALHLVPPAIDVAVAKGLSEGAVKYGAWNWRVNKVEAMTYVGAIKRHLAAWQDGEDLDPESVTGKSHLDGIAACLAILLDAKECGQLIDNRPLPGPGPRLVLTPKEAK